jgi:hypothetical protein
MKMWFWVIAGAAGIGAYYLLRKKKPASTLPSSSSHRQDPVIPASPAPPKAALAPATEWSGPAPRTPKAVLAPTTQWSSVASAVRAASKTFPRYSQPSRGPAPKKKIEQQQVVPQWQPGYLDPGQAISRYYPTPSRLNLNLGPAPSPRPMQPLPPGGFKLGPIIATTGAKG